MRRLTKRMGVGMFGMVVMAFGLLLWARLLLVASPPRTAVAKPAEAAGKR